MIDIWTKFSGRAQELNLQRTQAVPALFHGGQSAPDEASARSGGGMAVSIGRLREDTQYDYKFVCLSHNTLRGAAGGAVLMAELLAAEGYLD